MEPTYFTLRAENIIDTTLSFNNHGDTSRILYKFTEVDEMFPGGRTLNSLVRLLKKGVEEHSALVLYENLIDIFNKMKTFDNISDVDEELLPLREEVGSYFNVEDKPIPEYVWKTEYLFDSNRIEDSFNLLLDVLKYVAYSDIIPEWENVTITRDHRKKKLTKEDRRIEAKLAKESKEKELYLQTEEGKQHSARKKASKLFSNSKLLEFFIQVLQYDKKINKIEDTFIHKVYKKKDIHFHKERRTCAIFLDCIFRIMSDIPNMYLTMLKLIPIVLYSTYDFDNTRTINEHFNAIPIEKSIKFLQDLSSVTDSMEILKSILIAHSRPLKYVRGRRLPRIASTIQLLPLDGREITVSIYLTLQCVILLKIRDKLEDCFEDARAFVSRMCEIVSLMIKDYPDPLQLSLYIEIIKSVYVIS